MALRLTITDRRYDYKTSSYDESVFDVDLISDKELEFVDTDMETMLAAQALGFPVHGAEIEFYKLYTSSGFEQLVKDRAQQVHAALEAQGYNAFNHGAFEPADFAEILIRDIEAGGKKDADAKLDILKSYVDLSEDDEGVISQEQFANTMIAAIKHDAGRIVTHIETLQPLIEDRDYLVEDYIQALLNALSNQAGRHGYTNNIEEILDEVMSFMDEDQFEYNEHGPEWGESDWAENTEHYHREIKIYDTPIIEWQRVIESRIDDPIGFNASVTDYCEHGSDFCTPSGAEEILSYFNIEETEPHDPDDPDHPVSDEDGDYAVLYEKRDWSFVQGQGKVYSDEIEEQIVVPYDSESRASEAIELSKHILSRDGEEDDWQMRIIERKTEEEIDRIVAEKEWRRRQLPLLPEVKYVEEESIWDEWRELDEDEE